MPRFPTPHYLMLAGGLAVLLHMTIGAVSTRALEPAPHPFDTFLQHILNFKNPTGIRGTLRYIEQDTRILWLNWEERSDDRPLFYTGWKRVPGDPTLAVHPTDDKQFAALKHLPPGTPLELIIQIDSEGNRRILSWHDPSMSPKVPL